MKTALLFIVLLFGTLPLLASIHKIGDFEYPGTGEYITVVGNTAYIADGEAGLQILDVSDPENTHLLGSYDTEDANSVCVVGTIAYVTDSESGLLILDVSNPHNPLLKGTYETPYIAYSVKVINQIAYIADGDAGLVLVNVISPTNPQLISICDTPDYARKVAVAGNKAYIADGESGLQIINISNPQFPSIIGSCDSMYEAKDVAVAGTIAYVADGWFGLKIIDVSDPHNPTIINTYDGNRDINSVMVEGNKAYLTTSFEILDLTDLHNIKPLAKYDIMGWSKSIAVSNNTAYITTDESRLQILDISNTDSTQFAGSYKPSVSYYPVAIEVKDSIAFVIDYDYFRILNVSNPANIQMLGSVVQYNDNPYSVTIQDTIAYLCRDEGFKTIDISDLQNPTSLGYYSPFGHQLYITSLDVAGDIAYLTDSEWGLNTVDISNPHYPDFMGASGPGTGYAVAVVDTIAYVAYGYNSLVVFNVADPFHPQSLAYYFTSSYGKEITISGHYAYLYGDDSFLYIIDISNPRVPTPAHTIELHPTSVINNIAIQDNLLFVCDSNWNEINIYDISNASSPNLLKKLAWNLYTSKIFIENGKLYTLNGKHGLNIMDLNELVNGVHPPIVPQQQIHISNYPNPFKSNTSIDFSITNPGTVKIDIYNIKGQKVKELLNEGFTADSHLVTWNGKNDSGHAVASGIYFARISSDGKSTNRKLVLLK